MSLKEIPVRVVGPGSQPAGSDDEALTYLPMPNDMAKYVQPPLPEPDDVAGLAGARETMLWLRAALTDCGTGDKPQLANLNALDARSRDLVNQMLGAGEVCVISSRAGLTARTQETVLAGVWRTCYQDGNDRVVADVLEVAAVPHVVNHQDHPDQPVEVADEDAAPEIMNALPLLVELKSKLEGYRGTDQPHIINLTLLPLSETELVFLDIRLGKGPVEILSRAYGKCQVISTQTRNLWWVRYFNAMDTLILNTLEVVDVPQVVRAAPEDLRDSAQRLDEIIAPYWSDVA